jgi:hypothetical protein
VPPQNKGWTRLELETAEFAEREIERTFKPFQILGSNLNNNLPSAIFEYADRGGIVAMYPEPVFLILLNEEHKTLCLAGFKVDR